MNTTTDIQWFEVISETDEAVAEYVSDTVSEVYAMRAGAPNFARVMEDDGTFVITLLTNDKAELIAGEARLTGLTNDVVAATILAMLR